MEALLKETLRLDRCTAFGSGGGGCISSGQSYETDKGRIFVKINKEPDVRVQCFSVFIKFNFAVML